MTAFNRDCGRRAGRASELIVTADDFGLAPEVNEAVEIAHRNGILTAASLMVAGPAAANALARVQRMPCLDIGLHLVLTDGRPVLPAARIPDLIRADGFFRTDTLRYASDIFVRPAVRRQVRAEIAAQFAAYRATGLPLDHVDMHKHFHVHPTVARHVLAVGREFGVPRLRVPIEPRSLLRTVDSGSTRSTAPLPWPWLHLLRSRVRQAGIAQPDWVFGIAWSGRVTAARLDGLLSRLPAGLVELYTHPATTDRFCGSVAGYHYTSELTALCRPSRRQSFPAGNGQEYGRH